MLIGRSPQTRALVTACALLGGCATALSAQTTPTSEPPSRFWADVDRRIAESYRNDVEPAINAAVTDGTRFVKAVSAYNGWVKLAIMLGAEHQLPAAEAAIRPKLRAMLKTAIEAAHKRCVMEKDPTQSDFMFTIARDQGEILKWWPDTAVQFAIERVRKCRRFELVFTSYLGMEGSQGLESIGVTSTVPLRFNENWVVDGMAPITHTAWDHPPFTLPGLRCTPTTSLEDSDAGVTRFEYRIVWDKTRTIAAVDSAWLWLSPGEPTETLHICGRADQRARWYLYFRMAHGKEATTWKETDPQDQKSRMESGLFKITGWKRGSGSIFLRKEYLEPTDAMIVPPGVGSRLKGKTTLEIRHTPVM